MRLPLRRRRVSGETFAQRQAEALGELANEESQSELLLSAYSRADQNNAGMRFANLLRGGGVFGLLGRGRRPSVHERLREEGYDGD